MKSKIIKWVPAEFVNNSIYNIKSIVDNFNGLTIILECRNTSELLSIKWSSMVESYRCSTEEARFRFISDEWQAIRNEFPDWSFFKAIDSSYIKWVNEESGNLIDEKILNHYIIITSDYVLDIVSSHKPYECCKN